MWRPTQGVTEIDAAEWKALLSEKAVRDVIDPPTDTTADAGHEKELTYFAHVHGKGEQVRNKSTLTIVPIYIHNISVSKNYVRFGSGSMWVPTNPMMSFGSIDNYKQGFNLPVLKEKSGNLSNVFVLELSLSNVYNPFPYPIGLTVSCATKRDDRLSDAKANRVDFPRKSVCHDGAEFHAILPPLMNTRDKKHHVHVFSAGPELLHPWSEDFPETTAANLANNKMIFGPDVAVPMNDIVFNYIVKKASEGEYIVQAPKEAPFKQPVQHYGLSKNAYDKVIEKLRPLVETHIPVVDMNTFSIRLEHLNNADDPAPSTGRGTGVEFVLHSEIAFREKDTPLQDESFGDDDDIGSE